MTTGEIFRAYLEWAQGRATREIVRSYPTLLDGVVRLKLLLQRSLSSGPSWVESAHWDGERLYGFLERARGYESVSEPRFAPDGSLHWIREDRLYREGHDKPLTGRPTYKVAFGPDGRRLTIESESRDIPYGWCDGGAINRLDSSVNHLSAIPGQDKWLVSTVECLYSGPLESLELLGSFSSHRFTAGPGACYFTAKRRLFRRGYGVEDTECLFTGGGTLDYPLHTSAGIFVMQLSPARLWLVDERTGAEKLIWRGSGERLAVCDARTD